jgi:prepilin-type N-terminal cleavage/methylation domain-containing protein
METKRAFTLIEILIVIAILAAISSMIIIGFVKLNSKKALDGGTLVVSTALIEARSRSLASKAASSYGVHFDPGGVVIFFGTSYSPSDSRNEPKALDPRVGLRSISLAGGGNDIVFKRLTGATDSAGSLEAYLLSSPEIFRTISVNLAGVVSISGE